MYLLKRKISPYTEADIILGIFKTEEKAIQAKSDYIKICKENDKWTEQAYHEVDWDKELEISDISSITEGEITEELFVVSLYEEGFGQITRQIDRIFSNKEQADKYVEKKEDEEKEWEPAWYKCELVKTEHLYSDKK